VIDVILILWSVLVFAAGGYAGFKVGRLYDRCKR